MEQEPIYLVVALPAFSFEKLLEYNWPTKNFVLMGVMLYFRQACLVGREALRSEHLTFTRKAVGPMPSPRSSVMQCVCHRLGVPDKGDEPTGIHSNIRVKFDGEEGVDQGGVRRAWFELAAARFVRCSLFEDVEARSLGPSDPRGLGPSPRG